MPKIPKTKYLNKIRKKKSNLKKKNTNLKKEEEFLLFSVFFTVRAATSFPSRSHGHPFVVNLRHCCLSRRSSLAISGPLGDTGHHPLAVELLLLLLRLRVLQVGELVSKAGYVNCKVGNFRGFRVFVWHLRDWYNEGTSRPMVLICS